MIPSWIQGHGLEAWTQLFFAFAIGHAVADFALQTEFLARGKNRHLAPPAGELHSRHLWLYCLTAHALIHAGAVWVISGCAGLAVAELLLHWLIDWAKTEKKLGFHGDQALHLICKAVYAAILLPAPF